MSRPYQICKKCVMDTSDPWISFDEAGVCCHCHRYLERAKNELFHDAAGQARFQKLVEQIKAEGRGKPYDCVIGLSGGVDSTYVAYRVKQVGLRPLAIHFDNGWNTELAVSNIEKACKILGIDLHTFVMDWDEFRDIQLAFLKASVANIEIPTDHAITAILYQMASKHGIRYLVSGSNIETEGIMPRAWMYDSRDLRHLKAIHRKFGKLPMKTFPRYGLTDLSYHLLVRRIKFVRILNAAPYVKKDVIRLLESQLGWQSYGGKHHESIFTRFFQAYLLPKKFGIDKRRAHLSTLINSGQATREEAVEQLKQDPYPIEKLREDREFFIKKFELSGREFDEIVNAPVRSYSDYPYNSLVFEGQELKLVGMVKRLALGF